MEWLVFALLCPAFWGLNNVLYKFLITKKFRGYFPMLSFMGITDALLIAIVAIINPIPFVFPYTFFAMGVGLLPLVAFWFYSKALLIEEISRITPLFQFIPIFVVLLSVIFLDEILTAQRYLGVAIIIFASVLISYRTSKNGKSISAALKFMVPFTLILAVYSILQKLLLTHMEYLSVFFWNIAGAFSGVLFLMLFSRHRREFTETFHTAGKKAFIVMLVGEGVYFLGSMSWLIAASTGYVSLVSAFAGLQHFFVFIYVLLSSIFLPHHLKEELNKGIILLKVSAIALMVLGTWLISV
jgi:drug/metabolite transporter (DMT)-like permease